MPQLDVSTYPSQIFWLIVTFAALYFVLSRLVLPPLQELLDRRQQTVTGDIEEAQQLKSQAEKARQEYERMLAEARGRAQQLMADAERAHKEKSAAANKAMDQEIMRKLAEASQKISAKKDELIAALNPTASELATLIVEKLTQQSPSNDKVSRVIGNLSKTGSR